MTPETLLAQCQSNTGWQGLSRLPGRGFSLPDLKMVGMDFEETSGCKDAEPQSFFTQDSQPAAQSLTALEQPGQPHSS